MIELILCLVVAAILWPAVIRWNRTLDGAASLDSLRADPADVADLEAALPKMPGDRHYPLNEVDVSFLDAAARWQESNR